MVADLVLGQCVFTGAPGHYSAEALLSDGDSPLGRSRGVCGGSMNETRLEVFFGTHDW